MKLETMGSVTELQLVMRCEVSERIIVFNEEYNFWVQLRRDLFNLISNLMFQTTHLPLYHIIPMMLSVVNKTAIIIL